MKSYKLPNVQDDHLSEVDKKLREVFHHKERANNGKIVLS